MTEASSLPKRTGVLEQDVRVLQHRVEVLEKTPPRVTVLEQTVGILKADFDRMRTDIGEIKSETHETRTELREGLEVLGLAIGKNGRQLNSIFTAVAVVGTVVGVLFGALKIYDSSLSIQQKQQAIEARQDHKSEAVG